jgi:hypothetical protein
MGEESNTEIDSSTLLSPAAVSQTSIAFPEPELHRILTPSLFEVWFKTNKC